MDAYIVTFTHQSRSYNVWIWPESASVEVNVRDGGSWTPIQLDGGIVEKLEVQGSLFNG